MLQQLMDNDIGTSCFHNEKTDVEVSVHKTLNTNTNTNVLFRDTLTLIKIQQRGYFNGDRRNHSLIALVQFVHKILLLKDVGNKSKILVKIILQGQQNIVAF